MSIALCDPSSMVSDEEQTFLDWANGRLNSTRIQVEWWDRQLDERTRAEVELGQSSTDPWLANRLQEIVNEALDRARAEAYLCLDYLEGSVAMRQAYQLLTLIDLLQHDYQAARIDGEDVIAHGGKHEIEVLAVRPDVPEDVRSKWIDAVRAHETHQRPPGEMPVSTGSPGHESPGQRHVTSPPHSELE